MGQSKDSRNSSIPHGKATLSEGVALLRQVLGLAEHETPFPWQEDLLNRLIKGSEVGVLDIPTGLGKTSVMAIWLVARAMGAKVPRRMAYVVDRRAVVDQASDVALGLRAFVEQNYQFKARLQLGDSPLPISTLRGQHVDNREWQDDPSSPAIIVGTVDMVGSRLLFEGYGVSRKMRPYHAGLLGADTLVVLDEAHLVPPFEKLLEAIAEGQQCYGPKEEFHRSIVPALKLLSLSATGRASIRPSLGLGDRDFEHPVVGQRLSANKRLSLNELTDDEQLTEILAKAAWKLADQGRRTERIIIFCDKRKDAEAVKVQIEKLARGNAKEGLPAQEIEPPELFVGGRRIFEREQAALKLKELGFIAGTTTASKKCRFLIATSAGEVGVDLDADHMVSDLVTWERMIQRLGRVNRRGGVDRVAEVIVAVPPEPKPKKDVAAALKKAAGERDDKETKAIEKFERELELARALKRPFDLLPADSESSVQRDGSPGALRQLKLKASNDVEMAAILDAATSKTPLRPALTRAVVDAWSLTSLKEHTGRPDIEPWLRGWKDDDPPQTTVVWRSHIPVRTDGKVIRRDVESFFESAPVHASEQLETETHSVIEWLTKRAKSLQTPQKSDEATSEQPPVIGNREIIAYTLSPNGDYRNHFTLDELDASGDDKKALFGKIARATLVVDARFAGLKDGLLDSSEKTRTRTADDAQPWLPPVNGLPIIRFRVKKIDSEHEPADTNFDGNWRVRSRFITASDGDGEASRWLLIEKWKGDSTTEDDRAVGQLQLLSDHQALAEKLARNLAKRLGLSNEYENMLAIAARLHDEGKRSARWQRAFNAPLDDAYAKTPRPSSDFVAQLDGYRHEFGSLQTASADRELLSLSSEQQDLVLHLIAAHHGFARPTIGVDGCEDAPPSKLEERARDVALRFARLQKRWGPWGLAWWESLLRAVDHQASREVNTASSGIKEDH